MDQSRMDHPGMPWALDRDRATTTCVLAAAALSLGVGLQYSNGGYSLPAINMLTATIVLCGLALLLPRVGRLEALGDRPMVFLLGAGAVLQLSLLMTADPGIFLEVEGPQKYAPFLSWLAVAAVLVGAGLSPRPWLGRAAVPLLLVVHVLLGIWLIKASPHPHIDVIVFQTDSLNALLHGVNPYSLTFPDVFGGHSPFYGQGVVRDGQVQTGYPYPPINLLLELPGHLLGDVRYSHLLLMTAGGGLMAYARPGRLGVAAAIVYLFTPRAFYVLENSWTEPIVVFLLAGTAFCSFRAPRLLPYALGLFLASKQYLFIAAPILFLLLPRPFTWKAFGLFLAKAAATALVVTAPIALQDPKGFWHSIVVFQTLQPLRLDAMSYLAGWARAGNRQLGVWIAFAALVPTLLLVLLRAPRTPSGFAAGLATLALVFFAFNKQAFCNYYFFVIGALCVAIATAGQREAPATAAP